MTPSALRRALGAGLILILASLILGGGVFGGTLAYFSSETSNNGTVTVTTSAGSAFADGWLDAPASVTTALNGSDVSVTWVPGTHGLDQQKIYGADVGTTSNCNSASYTTTIATITTKTTTNYDDNIRAGASNGNYYCYQVDSTLASSTYWATPANANAVQVGLFAKSVALANANNAIANNDTITVTFNQKTNLANGTYPVCGTAGASGTGTISIASSGSSCGSSFGTISGLTIQNTRTYLTSTAVVASTSPWTVIITIRGASGASTDALTGKFTPSSSIQTNIAAHNQASACTQSTSNCSPTSATDF